MQQRGIPMKNQKWNISLRQSRVTIFCWLNTSVSPLIELTNSGTILGISNTVSGGAMGALAPLTIGFLTGVGYIERKLNWTFNDNDELEWKLHRWNLSKNVLTNCNWFLRKFSVKFNFPSHFLYFLRFLSPKTKVSIIIVWYFNENYGKIWWAFKKSLTGLQ
jgi:hypothetical protein